MGCCGKKDKPKNKNRKPKDLKFSQQQLKAWQPILRPSWFIPAVLLTGVFFTTFGAWFYTENKKVVLFYLFNYMTLLYKVAINISVTIKPTQVYKFNNYYTIS